MVIFRAPAKLNLTLEVLNRRADGYHLLRSLMVPIDLYDEVEIAPSAAGFRFACDVAELAHENLAEKAFRALEPPAGDWAITLRKRIPTQAGLGGGSSDAATVLIAAMNGAFGAIGERDFVGMARTLGSDVPFFLAQTGALVEGTGERVVPVGELASWHVLLVKPPVSISTAPAYARIDAHDRPTRARGTSVTLEALAALQRGDFATVQRCLSNDFHDVLAESTPEIAQALRALRSAGAEKPLLTGSGSCVFALFATREQRDEVAQALLVPKDFLIYRAALVASDAWRCAA